MPSSKIDINLPRIYEKLLDAKKNHSGSAVNEILWFRQRDKLTLLLLYYKNKYFISSETTKNPKVFAC